MYNVDPSLLITITLPTFKWSWSTSKIDSESFETQNVDTYQAAINGIATVEDFTTANDLQTYIAVLDDRGTLMGVTNKNGNYLEKLKYNITGLCHTHFRDYDPAHNRWLGPVPAGYKDGLNLYGAYMGSTASMC